MPKESEIKLSCIEITVYFSAFYSGRAVCLLYKQSYVNKIFTENILRLVYSS